MGNYFNIIPIILLDAFIILLFEGILFFTYLLQLQEKIIKEQIEKYIEKLLEIIDKHKHYIPDVNQIILQLKKINLDNANDKSNIQKTINELEHIKVFKNSPIKQEEDLNLLKLLQNVMVREEKSIEDNKKKGLLLFILIMLFIIIALIVYVIVVKHVFKATIEWTKTIIIVVATIFLIMIMEGLYVVYILFNKKFNANKFKLDLLKTLQ